MPGPIKLSGFGPMLSTIFAGVNSWRDYAQAQSSEAKKLTILARLAQLTQEKQAALHAQNLTFQKQYLQEEMKLRRELANEVRRARLVRIREQRETSLKIIEEQWRMEQWPLRLTPVEILDRYPNRQPYPLRVFLAPPELAYDSITIHGPMSDVVTKMENSLTIGLQKFLQRHYPFEDNLRPVEFMDGAWRSKQYQGRSTAITLHNRLSSESTMILELTSTTQSLELRVAYWGISSELQYNALAEIPLRHIVQDFARKRMESQNEFSPNTDDFTSDEYVFHLDDIDNAIRVTVNILCLITAWFADVHHLFATATPEKVLPLLPNLLSNFAKEPFVGEIFRPLLPEFVGTYRRLVDALKDEQPYCIPTVALHLAEGLSLLPEKIWAEQWKRYAMIAHLETFGVSGIGDSQLLDTYLQYVDTRNVDEIVLLKKCLTNLGDHQVVARLAQLESALRTEIVRKDIIYGA